MPRQSKQKSRTNDRPDDRSIDKYIDRFYRRLGLSTSPLSSLEANLLQRFDEETVSEIVELLDYDGEDGNHPETYPRLWQSVEIAQRTWPIFHEPNRALLRVLATMDLGDRIIDLGSGSGVTACFLAARSPQAEVIAVEPVEAGCLIAKQYAELLGLQNLQVVQSTIDEATPEMLGGAADTVLASLVLVEATRLTTDPPGDEWSKLNAIDLELDAGTGPEIVHRVSNLVAPSGRYIGYERSPLAVSHARWLRWMAVAGLAPESFTPLRFPGESVPLMVARPGLADHDLLRAMVHSAAAQELGPELTLLADPPVERLVGYEIAVEDADGSGRTRIEALRLTSGTHVVLQRTTRGWCSLEEHPTGSQATGEVRNWISQVAAQPEVVSVSELTEQLT